jgi:hypothetical protein
MRWIPSKKCERNCDSSKGYTHHTLNSDAWPRCSCPLGLTHFLWHQTVTQSLSKLDQRLGIPVFGFQQCYLGPTYGLSVVSIHGHTVPSHCRNKINAIDCHTGPSHRRNKTNAILEFSTFLRYHLTKSNFTQFRHNQSQHSHHVHHQ